MADPGFPRGTLTQGELQLIITDRVLRTREGNVFSLFTPAGVPLPGPIGRGGTPARSRWKGYSCQVQRRGVPQPGLTRGYPCWVGTPPRVPPCQTWLGGTPMGGYPTSYRITDGVLDTPRSVCLLRSRRRTFLFGHFSKTA